MTVRYFAASGIYYAVIPDPPKDLPEWRLMAYCREQLEKKGIVFKRILEIKKYGE